MKLSRHLPGAGKQPFWKLKWPRELLYGVPPILAATAVAIRLAAESSAAAWLVWLSAISAVWMIVALAVKVVSAKAEDVRDSGEIRHEGVYAAMSTLTAILTHLCASKGQEVEFRGTFHRVVPPLDDPEKIEQIIPYVGAGKGGAGRESSIAMGITGRAIRRQRPMIMSSSAANEGEHRDELVSEWGYTQAKAEALSGGRFSAMAVPILALDGRETLGVVYLDSTSRGVFDSEDVQQVVGVGCEAINGFVTKRYWT